MGRGIAQPVTDEWRRVEGNTPGVPRPCDNSAIESTDSLRACTSMRGSIYDWYAVPVVLVAGVVSVA